MYDIKLLSIYLVIFFAIALLAFPEKILSILPKSSYSDKLIQYHQLFSLVLILGCIYVYYSLSPIQSDLYSLASIPSTTTSPVSTISTSTTDLASTIPSTPPS